MKVKYPRTLHLPQSPGISSDDKVITDLTPFLGVPLVVTEKMDGENTSFTRDDIWARSLDSKHHPSRNWVKGFWGSIRHNIPEGIRICGENLYAKHSIKYEDLPSYFLAFSVWKEDTCLSWLDTLSVLKELGIDPVRYIEVFKKTSMDSLNEHIIRITQEIDTSKMEGVVIRRFSEFNQEAFSTSVAKWVRPSHVTSSEHWMNEKIIPNSLIK